MANTTKKGPAKGNSKSSTQNRSRTGSGSNTRKRNQPVNRVAEAFRADDTQGRVLRSFGKIILVILAVMVIVLMWRNRVELSCANVMQSMRDAPYMTGVGSGYPISLLGSDALAQERIADGMAVLTDTNMTVYNSSSKQVTSRTHHMTTPAMKTAGRYAMLLDVGGTKYRLEAISDTLIAEKADNVIIGGALARNGTFAVITQGSDYSSSMLSATQVFDRKGNVLHKWHSAEYYITDAALSTDGKYLAMCGVWAKDGELLSCIIMHKVGSEGEIAKIELPRTLCLSLEFTNTGTLYAVCDNRLVVVNGYGNQHESYEYKGTLQAYDVSYENGAAIYTAPVMGEDSGVLTIYDSRGQKRFDREVPLFGVSVSLGESGCCVLGRGGMIAYHLSGEKIDSWETGVSAEDILLIGSRAYLIEGISVEQYKIH